MWVCCIVFLRAEMREFEWFMVRHGNRRILWGVRFLRDRSMIRRACGDSYVEHDVCMEEQKGARGIKGAGNAAGRRGAGAQGRRGAGAQGVQGVRGVRGVCEFRGRMQCIGVVCCAELLLFALLLCI